MQPESENNMIIRPASGERLEANIGLLSQANYITVYLCYEPVPNILLQLPPPLNSSSKIQMNEIYST